MLSEHGVLSHFTAGTTQLLEEHGMLQLVPLMREPVSPAIKAGIARNFDIPAPLGWILVRGIYLPGGRGLRLVLKFNRS